MKRVTIFTRGTSSNGKVSWGRTKANVLADPLFITQAHSNPLSKHNPNILDSACRYLSVPLRSASCLALFLFCKVVAVCGSLEDLLSVASTKLGIRASGVFNGSGGLIDDIALIR